MAPALMNYSSLGGKASSAPISEKVDESIRALPASWYTTQEMYELERRAIFSKKWMLVTHKSRFTKAGDWIKFNIAGYEFILCMDRQGKINAFHNVCRHRAFPVLEGKAGNARILACKYHGWSYGLNGKLAKAPKYDELAGFEKEKNNLFPIHLRVDVPGFVWINLDASQMPESSWEENLAGIDVQERYKQYNFDDYVLDDEYQMDGPYNWKILADSVNNHYHCPTTPPDVPELADIATRDVQDIRAWIRYQSTLTEKQMPNSLGIFSSYFFPNVSISVLPDFIMLQRVLSHSPSSSSTHYQIFRNKNAREEDFQLISQMYKRIIADDKVLCELAQKNLNASSLVSGETNLRTEKGALRFQQVTREAIKAHYEREKVAKREIWPARQSLPDSAAVSLEDEEICSGLGCGQGHQAALAW